MKRVLLGLVFLMMAGLASATTVALDAVTSTATSSTFDTHECGIINVYVYSASTSACTVVIEAASKSSGPWFDVTQQSPITNPSSTGEYWRVPKANFYRVRVSARSSGTISATIDAYTNTGSVCY